MGVLRRRLRRRLRKWLADDAPPPPAQREDDPVWVRMFELIEPGGVGAEIGVWKGEMSHRFLRRLKPQRLYLFDLWEHMDDPKYKSAYVRRHSAEEIEAMYQDILQMFAKPIETGQVVVRRADSVESLNRLEDQELDFAYVDGDHSYEGVTRDLAAVWPKIKDGGLILCDDYKMGGWYGDGSIRAINEFTGAHADRLLVVWRLGNRIAFRKRPADGSDIRRPKLTAQG